jgi:hypothetical protein
VSDHCGSGSALHVMAIESHRFPTTAPAYWQKLLDDAA